MNEYSNPPLEREMKMGSVIEDPERNILWDWMNPAYTSIAALGDPTRSGRKELVKKIAQNIHQHDENVTFWITSETDQVNLDIWQDDSIQWIESQPDIPLEYDPDQLFRERRSVFPFVYFDLILQAKLGRKLRDCVPTLSYRSHMEGPLYGYLRQFEAITDVEVKQVLMTAWEATRSVKWIVTSEGRKFILPLGASPEEKVAQMALAMWSLWAYICRIEQPQQFLLIAEPDKDMTMGDHDSELKKSIVKILQIAKLLSEEVTMSLLLSLETMFPVPELGIRTRVFYETNQSDLDMFTNEHREFFGKRLHEEWMCGNRHAAYIQDVILQDSCIADLNPLKLQFIDSVEHVYNIE